ncbi:Lysine histidine transporter-like 8 [Camellia lanceoleosa]|uniref:Lysine histidine transporter-like 8 n=1 Tax=Camellia lanceoleosa TaxID=1840588 RepID=A0ACC0IGV3_9ERIC|nr:Lysine histidine transporter-like 8 [Camellia lanceoleosa]
MIQQIPATATATVMTSPDDRDIEATTMLANLGGSISHETEHNNPFEAWLPITESRDGNAFTSAFHVLCSGIGVQALLLPLAFTSLGWLWGIVCLSMAFGWQLYTIWVLVHLHESAPGTRYSRYVHLAIAAFGAKLGKLLAIFPVMYLSGGTCVMLIITGAKTMELFYQTICGDGLTCIARTPSGAEWFLVFTFLAIFVAQFFPNLNSIAGVSLIGAITAVGYCTLLWALSISLDRPDGASHDPSKAASSETARTRSVLTALGIIALAFRGHNLVLEIQGTMPSSSKHPSREPMWRGVTMSYILISMCLFPLAIGGYWAYGNLIPADGGMLITFSKFHGQSTSKFVVGLIYLLVLINCLCSFQIYAMLVFDNLEFRYTIKQKRRCPRLLRFGIRVFFGGLTYFIAMTFPFLPSLAALIGGITLPLTYAYPCFMWIAIKKPRPKSAMWWSNLCLGCLGIVLSVLLIIAAVWNIVIRGIDANFFRPH